MKTDIKNPNELRQSFLTFMQRKGAVIVPSAGLLPENDPTTLFTGSGMQPMIPYLLGEPHPSGSHVANVQKCLRTGDIDVVGDNSHLTFFEMTGRWAFGADPAQYKRDQLANISEWQIDELGMDPARLYISVYQGNAEIGVPRDDAAIEIWRELFRASGIDPVVEPEPWTYGASRGGRIFLYDEKENWWSRAGVPGNMPVGEPGGPDSEMFFDFDPSGDPKDHPATDTPRFLEIGNNVFMSHRKTAAGFVALPKPNIDYGGGLERIAAAVDGDPDIYRTAFFSRTTEMLEKISGRSYDSAKKEFRIILDHARAATFLISDGALPANVDAGYVTRRLMRRAVRMGYKLGVDALFLSLLAGIYIDEATAYPELARQRAAILAAVAKEEQQFHKTLQRGESEIRGHLQRKGQVTGEDAFYFYETFGFPQELTEELLREHGTQILAPEGFTEAMKQHADDSRNAAQGKFKGGLADHSDRTTALHSATHLMLAGMRKILGEHVHQRGSNITAERARFDFSHPEKLSAAQICAIEQYVNDAIAADAVMTVSDMPKAKAKEEGVVGSFWEKYPETVKVYMFADERGNIWSKELCGGPHVARTGVLGTFRILKEESTAAGVRRVKVTLTE
ncbi:MAG TPA: alanine--tRNA ligase [Patescibacteria group bacterium]|nr:alanine--tRNA ligase [Patescibacteria group bacterium]